MPAQAYPKDFEFLWEQFPRKVEKWAAFQEYRKLKPDLLHVVAAVWAQTASTWLPAIRRARAAGERDPYVFVPHPRKWLHNRGWLDFEPGDLAVEMEEAKAAFETFKAQGTAETKASERQAPELTDEEIRADARRWLRGEK
jgi:hypothetical protein